MSRHDEKWLVMLLAAMALVGWNTLGADVSGANNPRAHSESVIAEMWDENFNLSGDAWQINTPIPVLNGLSQTTVAAFGGLIYSIGGGVGVSPDQRINQVWAYDPAEDTWTRKADIPVPSGIVAHGAARALEGFIYVFGGVSGVGAEAQVLNTTWVYDIAGDAWTRRADLPSPRYGAAVALVGGRFIVAGGATLSEPLMETLLYDPNADTYTPRANLPIPLYRIHGEAVVAKDILEVHVFAGGFNGRNHLIYDPIADQWRRAVMMPIGQTDPAVVQVNEKFYVIGGVPPALTTAIGQIYDARRREWRLLGPLLPGPTNNTSGTNIGNTIYVIGGHNGADSIPTNYSLTAP